MVTRCGWVTKDPLYIAYHDQEWGVPLHNDRSFYERLVLEGAQAGLSWITILKRRENYRQAFAGFNPEIVARFGEQDKEQLLMNEGIIRNRRKIESAITNAKAFLKIQEEFGSFDAYVWQFVGGKPIINAWQDLKEVPTRTKESEALSKDLVKRGFKFVGPTICYALMQAAGLVNDHTVDCFRYHEICKLL